MSKNKRRSVFLDGPRIYLRKVSASDVNKMYCGWMNDPEVNKYLESRFRRHSLRTLKKDVTAILADKKSVFFAIVLKQGHRHIGNIKVGPINEAHRCADIGILIGEKDCWGKGYAVEAIQLVVDYAFNQLSLHKLTAGAYAPNQGSIKAFKKVGFLQEGIRRAHCYCQGKYVDDILLGLVKM